MGKQINKKKKQQKMYRSYISKKIKIFKKCSNEQNHQKTLFLVNCFIVLLLKYDTERSFPLSLKVKAQL